MGNQITKTVLVNSVEVKAIVDAHTINLGRRMDEYGMRDNFRFLVDSSTKELAEWNRLYDQFEDTVQQFQVEITLFEAISIQECHWGRLARFDRVTTLLECKRWKSIREGFEKKSKVSSWKDVETGKSYLTA